MSTAGVLSLDRRKGPTAGYSRGTVCRYCRRGHERGGRYSISPLCQTNVGSRSIYRYFHDRWHGWLSFPAVFFAERNGQPPKPADTLLSHRYACYNTYETADGRVLTLCAVENRFWRGLCEYLYRPEYIPLQYDEERRQEIIAFLRQQFLTKSLKVWEKELADMDICCSGVKTLSEVLDDPLFKARDMVHSYLDTNTSSAMASASR